MSDDVSSLIDAVHEGTQSTVFNDGFKCSKVKRVGFESIANWLTLKILEKYFPRKTYKVILISLESLEQLQLNLLARGLCNEKQKHLNKQ